jgi:hypothetical protein
VAEGGGMTGPEQDLLKEMIERISVIVVELETGETSVAYQIAVDLEMELEDKLEVSA